MIGAILRIARVPELKKKIVYTAMLLLIYRVGGFVPVPGINGEIAVEYFRQLSGGGQNLFQLVDIFSGGAFSQMTIFALGVVPYISSSIILQLLMALVPQLQRELRENPELGRKKVNRWTRYGTVVLSFIQAALFAKYAHQITMSYPGIVSQDLLDVQVFGVSWLFYLITIVTMTTGAIFLMWLGEQITEKGIGNGVSLIIALGILSSFPSSLGVILNDLHLDSSEPSTLSLFSLVVLFCLFVLVTVATILVIQGQRKIPLQYARRVVGHREVQGVGTSYLPLKVNYAGVVPVIFASSLLMFPATIGQFIGLGNWVGQVATWFSPGGTPYFISYVLLIVFFTYFWTATQFRPDQIASDMKKNGAFVPGVRQGKYTQEYLERTMSRVTFIGAASLALLAVLPTIIGKMMSISSSISYFFGGTALLILVGVVLDTMKQIESHLTMKRYEGFMKRGRGR